MVVTLPATGTGSSVPQISTDVDGGIHIQRVKLVTGATNVDGGNVTKTNPFPVGMVQDVVVSTLNSTTDPITTVTPYTGSLEATLGVAGIQVNIRMDQNATVYVDQFQDLSLNGQITDEYKYYAKKNNAAVGASWTIQATASYYRVRVKNDGTATASTVFLQTILCPVVEALPRSLDENGAVKVCVEKIDSAFSDLGAVVSPMGAIKTATSVRLVGAVFVGSVVDPNFWVTTGTTGTVTQANGVLTLSTVGGSNRTAVLNSVRAARYIASNPNYFRGVVQAPSNTTVTGTWLGRWGAYDVNDGFFFELNQANGGAQTLRLVCRSGGSDAANYVDSGNFNGEYGDSYILDNNSHTFEIFWSNSKAWFVIDGNVIHTFTGAAAPLTNAVSLKIGAESTNAGGNTATNLVYCRALSICRLGNQTSQPMIKYQAGVTTGIICKYGPGNLHSLIVSPTSTASTITLYDGTTTGGTVMFAGNFGNANNNTAQTQTVHFYGAPFSAGLFLVAAQGTPSITLVYE